MYNLSTIVTYPQDPQEKCLAGVTGVRLHWSTLGFKTVNNHRRRGDPQHARVCQGEGARSAIHCSMLFTKEEVTYVMRARVVAGKAVGESANKGNTTMCSDELGQGAGGVEQYLANSVSTMPGSLCHHSNAILFHSLCRNPHKMQTC